MGRIIRTVVISAFFLMPALFAGCMFGSADKLYVSPRISEESLALTALINKTKDADNELVSPGSGIYRRPVVLYDIDGDGSSVAFAFFKVKSEGLRINAFRSEKGAWVPAGSLSFEGDSFERVDFADLNADGSAEIAVSRRTGDGHVFLDVFSADASDLTLLLTSPCTDFYLFDALTGENSRDLVISDINAGETAALALYRFDSGDEITALTADFSLGTVSADRFLTGRLTDNALGLFVDCTIISGETVTDIFVYNALGFRNITLDGSGVSIARRAYPMRSFDVDFDRRPEVPSARLFPGRPGFADAYWIFDWYGFDSAGSRSFKLSTYHDFTDGWYFVIPEDLSDGFTVRVDITQGGERTVVFSARKTQTGPLTDFLTVCTFSGPDRHDLASAGGRFILFEQNSRVSAAEISAGGYISRDKAEASFFPGSAY
ncbi:MAG: hypothetical protein FWG32_02120 [Oscillospiraceae bacterium]|nr:hypothetical protein [Oscillospiraceae bacterium]